MFRKPLFWWNIMTSQQLTGTINGRECEYFMCCVSWLEEAATPCHNWVTTVWLSHVITGVNQLMIALMWDVGTSYCWGESCEHTMFRTIITLTGNWNTVLTCRVLGNCGPKVFAYCYKNNSYRKLKYSFDMQGLRELWSKSFCLLLQKYESERLLDPTGGSPDVVHLIKYVSLVLGWLHNAYTVSEANEINFQNAKILMSPSKMFFHFGALKLSGVD